MDVTENVLQVLNKHLTATGWHKEAQNLHGIWVNVGLVFYQIF